MDKKQPIHLYINSPGGHVYAGLAIHDTMQMIEAPVYTYAIGLLCMAGHSWKELEDYFLRDRYLNAEEAKSYGLVDEILGDSSNVVHLDYSKLIINTREQLEI